MAIQLQQEIAELINDKDSIKILTSIDDKGNPHAVIKQSLHVREDGNLVYLELLESSQTNKNMVRSIWFNHKIAIIIKAKDGSSYQIKGKPIKAIISGPIFEEHYLKLRERFGDVDLSVVWVLEPEEIIDQNFAVRKAYEEDQHYYFKHLDRLAKK